MQIEAARREPMSKENTVDWGKVTCPDAQEMSEDSLIQRAQQGDGAAFEELISRTHTLCLAVAMGILRDRDDAADEVQNAFWKAYTHIGLFSQQARFSTWVVRILINLCYVRLRRARRIRFVSYDGVAPDGEKYTAYDAIDYRTPERHLGGGEISKLVRSEVQHIPKLLRTPVELYYLQGVPIGEVARQLDLSVAATKSRLHRAQACLHDRMVRHCGMRGSGTLLSSVD
jgi:RNA polymerase sigma-70 factor, ECF subfamily